MLHVGQIHTSALVTRSALLIKGIVCAKEEKPITVLEEGHKSDISSSDCSPDDDDVLSDVGYFDNVLSDVDSDSELCIYLWK